MNRLSNLDAALRTRMRIEIKKLHQQLKTTSIFVTHDQEEAMMLSDFIAVMRDGNVVQYGPAQEIYRKPQHLYVATFIGKPAMSILPGQLRVEPDTMSFDGPGVQSALVFDLATRGQHGHISLISGFAPKM